VKLETLQKTETDRAPLSLMLLDAPQLSIQVCEILWTQRTTQTWRFSESVFNLLIAVANSQKK
jgi:hypothetical protein